ncbi:MAG: tellurite resistance TerB family protein [Solirubrobacterales bacterium]
MISHHAALIYVMVMVSAADRNMTDAELKSIGEIVNFLPIFNDYDPGLLPKSTAACAELLDSEDGLDRAFGVIKAALPPRLRETAYALACDVAAADGEPHQEVLRLLEMIRHRLDIDRLVAAAIERGARARFIRLDGHAPH